PPSALNRQRGRLDEIAAAKTVDKLLDIWSQFRKEMTGLAESLTDLRSNEAVIGIVRSEIRRRLSQLKMESVSSDPLLENLWHPDHLVIGNFSVFNSACDYVLVKQHFPIIPIRNLHLHPETTVRLVDLTCDSDGEISQFHRKDADEVWFTKDFHPMTIPGGRMGQGIPIGSIDGVKGSYFVIALTGAYQDVIEMDHNLLGDLPDVEIVLDKNGEWQERWMTGAESMEDILAEMGYVGFDIDEDPYIS
ncbi:MAG: hypothetical protein ACFFD6_00990, partial [Candidatus Thorarchaeota archaeon]